MRNAFTLSITAAAAVIAAGCQTDGGLNVDLNFGVYRAAATACKKSDPSAVGKTPCGMSKFRLCAASAAAGAVICQDYDAAAGEAGVELEVPEGEYTLSFQGYEQETVVWCGRALAVKVTSGETTSAAMFIARCSDFAFARGKLKNARAFHAAAPLPDGKVLLTGGISSLTPMESCDDACTTVTAGAFVDKTGKECTPSCRVLSALSAAEIYDPVAGTFSAAPANMNQSRAFHTATPLPDGKVVIAGGAEKVRLYHFPGDGVPLFVPHSFGSAGDSAEVYDPSTGKFTAKAGGGDRRAMHAAVPTRGGKVALVGGFAADGAADPSTTVAVGDANGFKGSGTALQTPRAWPVAIDYAGSDAAASSVLIWGGNFPGKDKGDQLGASGNYAEVWEESGATGSTKRPPLLQEKASGLPQFCHAAALLQDLRVVVAGGMFLKDFVDEQSYLYPAATPLKKVRIIDLPGEGGVFIPINESYEMRYPRALHTATVLQDGRILMAGGFSARAASCSAPLCFIPTDTVEVFIPMSEIFDTLHPPGVAGSFVTMGAPRAGHTATVLPDGDVLVAGGVTSGIDVADSGEVFSPYPNVLMEY